MIESIKEIRLVNALPKVFEGEQIHKSDIWQCEATFRKGELIVVAAESGTGKSSMCSYIFGARKDYNGTIYFDNTDVMTFDIAQWQQLRRTSLAYLPQELSLFPELTAIQNIRLKNDLTNHQPESRIKEWMKMLGIDSRTDFPVGRMSVGQQQRVGIIRALCQPFDFLILDEPVSHLDETNNRIAARLIIEEAERQGAGVISTSVGNHLLLDEARFVNL